MKTTDRNRRTGLQLAGVRGKRAKERWFTAWMLLLDIGVPVTLGFAGAALLMHVFNSG